MTVGFCMTLSISIMLGSGFIILVTVLRKKLNEMAGMVCSMAAGMLIGLMFGTFLGVFLKGNLLLSTVSGIIVGTVAGFLSGISFGFLSIIHGILSGMMGGMMGAMIGDMLPHHDSDTLIKTMFLWYVFLFLILYYYVVSNFKPKHVLFPFFTVFLTAILFVGYHELIIIPENLKAHSFCFFDIKSLHQE